MSVGVPLPTAPHLLEWRCGVSAWVGVFGRAVPLRLVVHKVALTALRAFLPALPGAQRAAACGHHLQGAFDQELVEEGGAPQAIWTEITAPADSSELRVAVTWQGKTPTRLPEALWVRCARQPAAFFPAAWLL